MLGREKHQGGIKNGELYAAAGQTYIGGQPCAVNSSGDMVLCTSGNVAAYVGVFAESSTVDGVTATIRAQATRYSGLNVLTLQVESDGLTYPYDDNQSWDEANSLYIDANGKWTNQATGSQTPFGVVLEVGSNYLVVQFYK